MSISTAITASTTWKCSYCTLENPSRKRRCGVCDQRRVWVQHNDSNDNVDNDQWKDERSTGPLSTTTTITSTTTSLRVYLRVGNRRQPKGLLAMIVNPYEGISTRCGARSEDDEEEDWAAVVERSPSLQASELSSSSTIPTEQTNKPQQLVEGRIHEDHASMHSPSQSSTVEPTERLFPTHTQGGHDDDHVDSNIEDGETPQSDQAVPMILMEQSGDPSLYEAHGGEEVGALCLSPSDAVASPNRTRQSSSRMTPIAKSLKTESTTTGPGALERNTTPTSNTNHPSRRQMQHTQTRNNSLLQQSAVSLPLNISQNHPELLMTTIPPRIQQDREARVAAGPSLACPRQDRRLSPPCSQQSSTGMVMFRYTPPSQEHRSNQSKSINASLTTDGPTTTSTTQTDQFLGYFHYTPPSQERSPISSTKEQQQQHLLRKNPSLSSSLFHAPTTSPQQQLTATSCTWEEERTNTQTITTRKSTSNTKAPPKASWGDDMHPPPMNTNEGQSDADNTITPTPFLAGFSTAGTKSRIHVGEAQLQKAERLLEPTKESRMCPWNGSSNHGVRTGGSPLNIRVDQTQLYKSERFFENDMKGARESSSSGGPPPMVQFQTAGSKSTIHVDEQQLRQAEHLLEKQEDSFAFNAKNQPPSTARRHFARHVSKIPVDQALRQTERWSAKPFAKSLAKATMPSDVARTLKAGFQTAGSGSTIRVDEEQLRAAARMLREPEETTKDTGRSASIIPLLSTAMVQPAGHSHSKIRMETTGPEIGFGGANCEAPSPNPNISFGFIAAGSKCQIQVSPASLDKARQLLEPRRDEVDSSAKNAITMTVQSANSRGTRSGVIESFDQNGSFGMGFSTSGSKSRFQASEAGSKRARSIFESSATNPPPTKPKRAKKGEFPNYGFVECPMDNGNDDNPQLPNRTPLPGVTKTSTLSSPETTLKRKPGSHLGQPCTKRRVSFEPLHSTDPRHSIFASSSFQTAGSNTTIRISDDCFREAQKVLDDDNIGADGRQTITNHVGDLSASFQTAGSMSYIQVAEHSIRRADDLLRMHAQDNEGGDLFEDSIPFGGSVEPNDSKFDEYSTHKAHYTWTAQRTTETISNLESNGPTKGGGRRDLALIESQEKSGFAANVLPLDMSVSFRTAGSKSEIKVDEESLRRASTILENDDSGPTENSSYAYIAVTPAAKKPWISKDSRSQSADCRRSEVFLDTHGDGFWPSEIESAMHFPKEACPEGDIFKNSSLGSAFAGHPLVTPRASLGPACDERANEGGSSDCSYGCELNLNHRFGQDSSMRKSKPELDQNNGKEADCKPAQSTIPAVTPMRDSHSEFRLSNGEGIFFGTNAIAIPGTNGDCPHVSSVSVPTLTLINLPGAQENVETNDDKLACQPEAPACIGLAAALHTGALRTSPEVWRECEVSDITCNITSQNAQKVLFDETTGRPVAFDVSHSDELVGSTESLMAGLAERGCSLEILDKLWVENHKRWIVWKLASYERSFCDFLGGKYLTFERLLEGLERRYKVELVGGKRPATRMILHRDAAASLPMILCVSELILSGGSLTDEHAEGSRLSTRLRLTDGWYEIEAALDTPMGSLITKGIVRVGTKLLVSNAVLRGAQQGIDPLDADYASTRPYLVLTANSTRLAKWDSKLGFLRVSSASFGPKFCPVKRVSDIVAGGGDVHFLRLLVMRRFPIMYIERGSTGNTTLSEAEEDERRRELERRRTRSIEKLSDAVTKEVEKEIDADAPEVWTKHVVGLDGDVDTMSEEDRTILASWMVRRRALLQQRVQEEVEAELETDMSLLRKSTPFIRVLVHTAATINLKDTPLETAVLTIWDPAEEQLSILNEGEVIEVQGVGMYSSIYDGFLQLSSSGKSPMRRSEPAAFSLIRKTSGFEPRKTLNMFRAHVFAHRNDNRTEQSSNVKRRRTFDTVGVTVSPLMPSVGGMPGFELYLTDQSWLLLRVHFEKSPYELTKLQGRDRVIALNDLQMLEFDVMTNCAVTRYTGFSSVSKVPPECLARLEHWKKESPHELERVSAYLEARVPLFESSRAATIIGAIVGLNPLSDASMLSIDVDSGGESIHELSLPTSSLSTIRDVVEKSPTFLLASEESRLEGMTHLDFLFRAHGVLFRFDVTKRKLRNKYSWVVQKVEKADLQGMARLHSLWP